MVDRVHERSASRAPALVPALAPAPAGGRRAGGVGPLLLALQRRHGNRFVQRVVADARLGAAAGPAGRAPLIQAKLVVGAAGDQFERDADRVARRVASGVARAEAAPGLGADAGRVRDAGGTEADPWVAPAVAGSRGGGRAIPERVRAPIERALGADLGAVRVHTDMGADELNRALGSNAFTTGQHVFFRRGAYLPASPRGRALLAHEAAHVVQQQGSGATGGVVQLERPEDFTTYEEAKNFNAYSRAHLDEQENDLLREHIGKSFTADERDNIYATNEQANRGQLSSDSDGTALTRMDSSTVPHVDHRFPKSKGGSNSYTNAAVIPALENIQKSDKVDLAAEPMVALAPYRKLKDPPGVMRGADFSAEQKQRIYDANIAHYRARGGNGWIVSDADKRTRLERSDSADLPHVDHITPKSDDGSNYYFNAKVISAEENIQKGGVRARIGTDREERYDDLELGLTLPRFIDYTQGVLTEEQVAPQYDSDEEEREVRAAQRAKKRKASRSATKAPPKKKAKTTVPIKARKAGGARVKGPRKRTPKPQQKSRGKKRK